MTRRDVHVRARRAAARPCIDTRQVDKMLGTSSLHDARKLLQEDRTDVSFATMSSSTRAGVCRREPPASCLLLQAAAADFELGERWDG